MNLHVRLLGIELLTIQLDTETTVYTDEPGDCTTTPIGFNGHHPDQRWATPTPEYE